MLHNTRLSLIEFDTNDCHTLGIIDSSYYNPSMTITGQTLQVIVPGYNKPVELSYTQSGVTILNSNNLGVTNVVDEDDYQQLPDGAYTIKITICPYDQFWAEKTFYRTCQLECKYSKAILSLDMNSCTDCFDVSKSENLDTIRRYIQGVKANANDCNIKKATELYNVANSMLDNILNCDCGSNDRFRSSLRTHHSHRDSFNITSPTGCC